MRAILVSVNYADMIAVTLPAWKKILPEGSLSVATSPEDFETHTVCQAWGVPIWSTDAWTRKDPDVHLGGEPTFNAALGMDEALGLAGSLRPQPAIGDLIVNINADCYPVGTWPDASVFKPGWLYGFWRHHVLTPADFDAVLAKRTSLPPKMKNSGGRPVGYLQAWRYIDGYRFGSYPTAGKYDTHFCNRFPGQMMLPGLHLLHLGPQASSGANRNWGGRVVPRWEPTPA